MSKQACKLKICFIATDVVSFNLLCRGQLEEFSSRYGFDCSYVCGGNERGIALLKQRDVGRVFQVDLRRKPKLVSDLKSLVCTTWILLTLRPEIVVYSTPKAMLIGAMASFFSRRRVRVALVRGRVYENYQGLKRKLYELLDRVTISLSTHCIFISRSLATAVQGDGIAPARKAVVLGHGSSNGVDLDTFSFAKRQAARHSLRSVLGFRSSDTVVVSMGRACLDKGVSEFAQVVRYFSPVSDIKFIWVGSIEDEESANTIRSLEGLGSFLYIPQTRRIQDILFASDLHLFLSRREGFGNVAIEAAAAGVPTLAFDVVGVRDSVCDGVSGHLVAPGDVAEIVRHIERYVQHDGSGYPPKHMLEWVKRYSQEVVWESYANFYLSLVK